MIAMTSARVTGAAGREPTVACPQNATPRVFSWSGCTTNVPAPRCVTVVAAPAGPTTRYGPEFAASWTYGVEMFDAVSIVEVNPPPPLRTSCAIVRF